MGAEDGGGQERPAIARRRPLAWLGTVRARSTIAAVLVVGLALAIGAVALVSVLRENLTREVRETTQVRAEEIASVLGSGRDLSAAPAVKEDEQLVQVLDATGHVVAASPNMAGKPAVANLRPGESATVDVPVDDDPFLAVAVQADTPNGKVTVIVARALVDVFDSTAILTRLLLIGLPALLLLVGLTTWKVVGWALRPVDAIRSEVDEISAVELHRRVPLPPGDDEIARLAATMNQMLDRLENAQVSQRRFVSDASHELRSPVASIRQHAEVAIAHPDRAEARQLAETVLAEDLRMQRLVDDLLLLARADEHGLHLRRRPVDLDDVVFAEAKRLKGNLRRRISTTAVSAVRIDGDEAALARMVRNLGENAARHAEGLVTFSLTEAEGAALLVVTDDGPGIPPEMRERVFERFVRLDNARDRDRGGSGLGLAIVAEIARAHGGAATIADSDRGARIEIRLPH